MSTADAKPLRLLVIDDDPDTVAALRALLRGRLEEPQLVDCVSNADEGLRTIAEHRHDVYLVDRALDAARGGEIVRAAVAAGHAPLMLLAGHRDLRVEREVLESGVADFLWKEELSAPLVDSVIRHSIDVTARVGLERQLYMAQRMETVGRLAGGIAHDFNNILTAIVGFGTLLGEHVADDEAASGQVREILSGAERAATLTRQLLAFGRRQVLQPTRLDLADVVRGLAGMWNGAIGDNIHLQMVCGEQLPPIRADRAQIEQAITNLVFNARDAMPEGGRLTIEIDHVTLDKPYCATHVSARPGRYLRLAVSDTGSGIPPDLLPRVFEPFSLVRERAGASGLALATVYGIVKQSGGNIWVYSEAGFGTTFKIYLPIDVQDVQPSAAVPRRVTSGGAETILLVDDADVIRRLARKVLNQAGYQVLDAAGADEALHVAGSHPAPIDLLLTDVVMPGRTGVELAERLRGDRTDVRVLYMSGYADHAVVKNGLLAQGVAFLQKPFTPEDLLRKVREVLEVS